MDVSREVAANDTAVFDLDDVFSDSDAHEMAYQFSQEGVREEMARNISRIEDAWTAEHPANAITFSKPQDPSFFTIDIDETEQASHSQSPSRSQTPHSLELHDKLPRVSLDVDEPPNRDAIEEIENDAYNSYLSTNGPPRNQQPAKVPSLDVQEDNIEHGSASQLSPLACLPDSAASTQSLPTQAIAFQTSPAPVRPLSATPIPKPEATAVSSSSSISSSHFRKPSGHRPTRSTGPSVFEKVRSKTRPTFLPPKPRQEDDKHMAYWQSMMKQSRATAEKRRKALQERRLARERYIEESIHIWDKEVVPDWTVVHKNPSLRRLWWKGIPVKLRASMWERAVGNSLALSKDHYRTCLSRARKALLTGVFPPATLNSIEEDISSTLPSLHIFNHQTGPLYEDLKEMLCAWVVSRSDEGLGYTRGAAKIAAMLLINMPAQQGFVVMKNLLERHCMRSFYGGEGSREDVEAYYRIFDTLLADGMPKIYFNFKQHQISPAAYLNDWLLPLFLDHLPFEACARIWDVLLLEGDSFLFRAALAIFAVLEPRLFFPDRNELLELLKGENKAALEVAKRDGQRLDGGRYQIYGVDEETLWERIDDMNDWWKESTWTRLLQRELPDL